MWRAGKNKNVVLNLKGFTVLMKLVEPDTRIFKREIVGLGQRCAWYLWLSWATETGSKNTSQQF